MECPCSIRSCTILYMFAILNKTSNIRSFERDLVIFALFQRGSFNSFAHVTRCLERDRQPSVLTTSTVDTDGIRFIQQSRSFASFLLSFRRHRNENDRRLNMPLDVEKINSLSHRDNSDICYNNDNNIGYDYYSTRYTALYVVFRSCASEHVHWGGLQRGRVYSICGTYLCLGQLPGQRHILTQDRQDTVFAFTPLRAVTHLLIIGFVTMLENYLRQRYLRQEDCTLPANYNTQPWPFLPSKTIVKYCLTSSVDRCEETVNFHDRLRPAGFWKNIPSTLFIYTAVAVYKITTFIIVI